jgi:hypothetical protein
MTMEIIRWNCDSIRIEGDSLSSRNCLVAFLMVSSFETMYCSSVRFLPFDDILNLLGTDDDALGCSKNSRTSPSLLSRPSCCQLLNCDGFNSRRL